MVFLIDGSESVRSGFPLLKEFVQRVVESLDVGPDRVRVALVQYSDRTRPEFYLNSFMDQQGVLNAISRLAPLGGPTPNTGAALDFVLKNILVGSAGSRIAEGVPQLLIVLTADRSGDDVQGPSVVLKKGGAVPIGIGIGNADITEMQTISFIPDFAVAIPTFRQLGTVQQVISERVTQLSREELSRMQPFFPPQTVPGEEGVWWGWLQLGGGSSSLQSPGTTCLDSGLLRLFRSASSVTQSTRNRSCGLSWDPPAAGRRTSKVLPNSQLLRTISCNPPPA